MVGWILEKIFHKTVAIKGEDGNYYLNCKSVENWLKRVDPEQYRDKNLEKDTHNSKWVTSVLNSVKETKKIHKKDIVDEKKEDEIKPDKKVEQKEINLDEQLKLSPKITLVSFGQFRKSTDGGEPPNFITVANFIENENMFSAGLACCFHTAESKQEIWKLIEDSRLDYEKTRAIYQSSTPNLVNVEPYVRFYNNLVNLHMALPGDEKAKSAKIYWTESVEKVLFPYFFKNEGVNVDDLVFAITRGEEGLSPFQAPEMDFSKQLQFVGIGKEKIMGDQEKEIKQLSQEIFGKNILSEIEDPTG